jgi:signal transduction histidine kinase/ligand-binding sensor domain-containing protein
MWLLIASLLYLPLQVPPDNSVGEDFVVTRYTMADGLPVSSANIVRQSPDRYLWIATYNGLVRFNGTQFKIYDASVDSAFRSNRIRDVYVSKSVPGLWLMIESGGVIYYDYKNFIYLGEADGFTDRWVVSVLDHPNGILLLGTNDGAYTYNGTTFRRILDPPGTQPYRIEYIAYHNATVWMATSIGILKYDVDTGEGSRISLPDPDQRVHSVVVSPTGQPYFVNGTGMYTVENDVARRIDELDYIDWPFYQYMYILDGDMYFSGYDGLYRMRNGYVTRLSGDMDFDGTSLINLTKTKSGRVFASFTAGELVEIFESSFTRFDKQYGIDQYQTHRLSEDDEGNIWIATRYGGLLKLTDNQFNYIGMEDGLSFDNMLALFEDSKGRLWMSVRDHGVYIRENGQIRKFNPPGRNPLSIVYSITETLDGSIWFASYEVGIFRYTPEGAFQQFRLGDLGGFNTVFSLFTDRDGGLWVGTAAGLIYFKNGQRVDYDLDSGLEHLITRYITQDKDGTIWVGTQGAGIARLNSNTNRFEHVYRDEGMRNKPIRSIYPDAELGGIWIGTETHGLYFLSEAFSGSVNTSNGLPDNVIHSIIDTRDGNLWMHTNRGIFMGKKQEFLYVMRESGSKVDIVIYNADSGMRNAEGNGGIQPAAILDRNGMLLFSTQRGVAGILPYFNRRTPAILTMLFESISAGNFRVDKPGTEVTIPKGNRNLVVEFSGLHYTSPKRLNYEYRFVGYSDEWQYLAEPNRITFFNIPHGVYTLEIKASDIAGLIGTQILSIRINIPPIWSESLWFYTVIALGVGLLVYAFFIYNLQKEHREQEKLRDLVEKRTLEVQKEKHLVEERNKIIEAQSTELQKANGAKDNFIYLLGHDLRSPMQAMLGSTSLLETDYDNLHPKERNQLVRMTRQAFERLNALIINLLDWAQMDAGLVKPNLKPLHINELIREVSEIYSSALKSKKIRLFIQISEEIHCISDVNMLKLALRNLISNAIKFSPEKSDIIVRAEVINNELILHVIDHGVGMSEEQISRLFEIGNVVTTLGTKDEKGTGIGLLLVWQVFKLLEADLTIESKPGKGTHFKIKLPFIPVDAVDESFDSNFLSA